MNKPVLLSLSGAALFAAGYFARELAFECGDRAKQEDSLTTATGEQIAPGSTKSNTGTAADRAVRPFVPGRPFVNGRARDWIAGVVSAFGGDRRGDHIAMMNLTPVFLTMDADSVREAIDAVRELSAIEDVENPARRRNPNGDGKLDTLMMLAMVRLAQTNPDEALAVLRENFNHNDGSTRLLVFGRLAADDPQRAEQMALSLDREQQREGLEAVMYALVNHDPQAALALANRHSGVVNENQRERIMESWVRRDPLPAMEAAVQETAKSKNPELVRNTVEEWSKFDPAAASQWASEYQGPGSVTARAMMLERRAREEPHAVLHEYAALQQAAADPKELARLTSAIANSLAGRDLAAARAWAQNVPAGELQDLALHQIAGKWVKQDPAAAAEWIQALPSGRLRDGAARELTSVLSRRDPATAFEWARSIENSKLREGALHNVLQNWREQEPEAANAALDSLPAGMRPPQTR